MTPKLLCLIVALVLFVAGALWVPPAGRPFNLVSAGLAFLALSFLVP